MRQPADRARPVRPRRDEDVASSLALDRPGDRGARRRVAGEEQQDATVQKRTPTPA